MVVAAAAVAAVIATVEAGRSRRQSKEGGPRLGPPLSFVRAEGCRGLSVIAVSCRRPWSGTSRGGSGGQALASPSRSIATTCSQEMSKRAAASRLDWRTEAPWSWEFTTVAKIARRRDSVRLRMISWIMLFLTLDEFSDVARRDRGTLQCPPDALTMILWPHAIDGCSPEKITGTVPGPGLGFGSDLLTSPGQCQAI